MDNQKIWIENPTIFIKNQGYLNFLPNRTMTKTEQINSLTLLLLYVLILLYILESASKYSVGIIVGLVIVMLILHYGYYSKQKKESYDGQDMDIESGYYDSDNNLRLGRFYSIKKNKNPSMDISYEKMKKYLKANQRRPTPDNPFMNPLLTDYNTENIPQASNVDDEDIQTEMKLNFNKDLFRDNDDLFDRKNAERIFYTVPGGSIPNDQDAFAKWCYGNSETCHNDSRSCYKNKHDDLRYINYLYRN